MSLADVGKTPIPVSGPAAVAQIAVGFLGRAFRGKKPTVYKIGGVRVSGPEFRARVPFTLPGQRPAPGGKAATVSVTPPTATRPSDPGYRPDLTERRLPPLKKGPAPKQSAPPPSGPRAPTGPDRMPVPPRGTPRTLAFAGAWLRRAGYVGTIIWTVEWIARKWQEYFPGQPLPDKPPPRAGGPGSQGGKGSNRPQPAPEIVFSPNIIVNVPRTPPLPQTAPAPLPSPPTVATPMPAPSPRPAPAPAPAPAPRSTGIPTWLQYAGAVLPLLLSQSKRPNRRRTPRPSTTTPGLTPGIVPGLGLQPTPADLPLATFGNYFDSTPTQTKNCDCAPKKRKPKKKRTKCYTGRFTERASGLRKYQKRAIKCR